MQICTSKTIPLQVGDRAIAINVNALQEDSGWGKSYNQKAFSDAHDVVLVPLFGVYKCESRSAEQLASTTVSQVLSYYAPGLRGVWADSTHERSSSTISPRLQASSLHSEQLVSIISSSPQEITSKLEQENGFANPNDERPTSSISVQVEEMGCKPEQRPNRRWNNCSYVRTHRQ